MFSNTHALICLTFFFNFHYKKKTTGTDVQKMRTTLRKENYLTLLVFFVGLRKTFFWPQDEMTLLRRMFVCFYSFICSCTVCQGAVKCCHSVVVVVAHKGRWAGWWEWAWTANQQPAACIKLQMIGWCRLSLKMKKTNLYVQKENNKNKNIWLV